MGASAGPSLQGIGRGGASNLVLEMDAHDAKSYPGEPTTNYIYHGTDGIPNDWWGDGSNQSIGTKSVVDITDNNLKYNGYPTILWTPGDSYNVYLNGTSDIDQSALSTVWTFSCYVRAQDGGTLRTSDNSLFVYFYRGTASYPSDSGTGTITDVGGGWHRVHLSVSGTSNYAGLIGFSSFRAEARFYLSGAQLEKKTYPTPFVTGALNSGEVYDGRPATTNLMIHGNVGTGTSFYDSSPSGHTVTAGGNTTHSSGQSKFSGGSIYFDGTDDYLQVPNHTDFAFGSGDFTVDAWIYGTDAGQNEQTVFCKNIVTSNYGWVLNFNDGGGANGYVNLGLLWSTNGSSWASTTRFASGITANSWHHVAVVRSGTTITVYVDGTSIGAYTGVGTFYTDGQAFQIGAYQPASGEFEGYIDEVRVTKGTALWISAFTPPTRRNLSAPVVDRSGNDNGGNFNTTDMTDVSTYRVGEVIRPIDSATWDFDGTDDRIECSTDPFDLKCFELAIQQYQAVTPDGGMGGYYSNVGFTINNGASSPNDWKNGLNIGSWTGGMTDETVSWWGYGTGGYWATYIKDTIPVGWHIYTFNWNGSSYDIWIDGVKKTTYHMTAPAALFQDVITVSLGVNQGWDYWFKGKMGCVRCYDISLTDQQVKENFNQQRSRFNI